MQNAVANRRNYKNGMEHTVTEGKPLPVLDQDAEQLLNRIATGMCERVRLQLLAALLHGERSVTELTQVLQRSQPSVSKHLRLLRDQQLVRTRRDRNRVFYRIADDDPAGQAVRALVESLERSLARPPGRK